LLENFFGKPQQKSRKNRRLFNQKIISKNRIFNFVLGTSEKGTLHLPHTAKPPKIGKFSSIDQDTQLCRLCCGTLYDISRTVEYLTQIENVAHIAAEEVQENESNFDNFANKKILYFSFCLKIFPFFPQLFIFF